MDNQILDINSYALTKDDLEKEYKHLIQQLLFKETIMLFYSKAGGGKSILTINIAIFLLLQKLVDRVIYLDGDNSKAALKSRGIDDLVGTFPQKKFLYVPSFKIDSNLLETVLKEVRRPPVRHNLIVIDSIRNFMNGQDASSDKHSMAFMTILQKLRDAGNTIIILHHVNKKGTMKNSTSYQDFSDVAYEIQTLESNGERLELSLQLKKDRMGCLPSALATIGFGMYKLQIKRGGYDSDDADIAEAVILKLKEGKANTSQIMEFVNQALCGRNRNSVSKVISKYSGILWNFTKGLNNSKIYELIFDDTLVDFEFTPITGEENTDKTDTTQLLT